MMIMETIMEILWMTVHPENSELIHALQDSFGQIDDKRILIGLGIYHNVFWKPMQILYLGRRSGKKNPFRPSTLVCPLTMDRNWNLEYLWTKLKYFWGSRKETVKDKHHLIAYQFWVFNGRRMFFVRLRYVILTELLWDYLNIYGFAYIWYRYTF